MTLNRLGLRTAIYPAPDLNNAKACWPERLGQEPHFDQPFYVGNSVAGYELALLPGADPADGVLTYWGVADVQRKVDELIAAEFVVRTVAFFVVPSTAIGDQRFRSHRVQARDEGLASAGQPNLLQRHGVSQ